MRRVIISDTSCLVILEKIGELNLLQKLFGEVCIPQEMALEWGYPLPEWILLKNPADKDQQLILEVSLDKGESSAIALALEHKNHLLLIDECAAHPGSQHVVSAYL